LLENTRAELSRHLARLRVVREQIRAIEQKRLHKIAAAPTEENGPHVMVRLIARVFGVETADMLVNEVFARHLRDRIGIPLRSRSDPRPQRLPGKICHLARVVDEPPHHVGSDGHQAEFRPLLFREVYNAIAELLEYAAIVSERFHRPDLNHPSLVA
jgi:hypothetical protein